MTAVFLCFRLGCLHDCLPILSFIVILRLRLLLLFLVVLVEPVEQSGELTGGKRSDIASQCSNRSQRV